MKRKTMFLFPAIFGFVFLCTLQPFAFAQHYENVTGLFLSDGDSSFDVEIADVDGDTDLDILVANDGPNRLYINDGTYNFPDETANRLPAGTNTSTGAEFGDIDNDGDLDIFIANFTAQNKLYINDGTGVFTDVTSTRLPIDTAKSIDAILGDVDNDGDLDILVVNNLQQNRLLINDGTGKFTDGTATRLPAETCADCDASFGDVDGDGDIDLAVANCDTSTAGDKYR
jgi:hypothetical protein